MAEPSLTDIFGTNALQDETTVTIAKADLASAGLTASATNKAEALLFAILLKAKSTLTPTNLDNNIDQSISIDDGVSSLDTRQNTQFRQQSYTVYVQKLDTTPSITPTDL